MSHELRNQIFLDLLTYKISVCYKNMLSKHTCLQRTMNLFAPQKAKNATHDPFNRQFFNNEKHEYVQR